ncbi:nitronate monooxygenase [Actinoplanes sp. NBRC 101535]|uniref:nitronate monooxygenase n=1 Tax=Actinoplanes sp. NBRC 101535 TaxID=3032196 RepID=UPI0024A242B5|nr:nitronate monooxygenase [Actinoplanes sp. NBRC 101535]GLY06998.1 oxidoreductase [Actinoplanes sp. NBRC 101535]
MRLQIPPVVVAPMAGGPSTPELVLAAASAGALGFLPAGYKTPGAVEDELRAVAGSPFGLNIFVPTPPPSDTGPLERFRLRLRKEFIGYELPLPPLPKEDDDGFTRKVEVAVAYAPPLVTFTFGVPPSSVVGALQRAGSTVLITVTSAGEAVEALRVAPDGLIAQAGTAGGHSATTHPESYRGDSTAAQVLAEVRAVTDVPVVVAGGVSTAAEVSALRRAGAAAVQCGTAFLLADEAGTRPVHRTALTSGEFTETAVTRAFTGQPARGLRNRFIDEYSADAPIAYPAVHHLTAGLRAAAAAAGDTGTAHLWAGTGFASAREAPLADLLGALRDGQPF